MRKAFKPSFIKNQDGYALVEIILSIGILAIVGLYVIEMFVLAGTTQSKARDLDTACLLAQTAVEDARAGNVFLGDRYYSDKWIEVADFREDGFTLSAHILETYPPQYSVAVYKNGEYVFFTGEHEDAGEPLFSLDVALFGEVGAG